MNIGFGELIMILLVAFLVVGPKDLPKVARWLGRQVRMIRRMIEELKKETGWDDMEREINQTKKELDVRDELRDASQELQRNLNALKKDVDKMDEEAKKEREARKNLKP